MFVQFSAVCEIITYELPNVLHHRFKYLTFKMNNDNVADFDENWPANLLVTVHMYVKKMALLGTAIYSLYINVHFVHDERTD